MRSEDEIKKRIKKIEDDLNCLKRAGFEMGVHVRSERILELRWVLGEEGR